MARHPTDEELAFEYLGGKVEQNERGQIVHKFHEPGSDGETAAREALVRLLKGDRDLSVGLRHRIAALLDPTAQWEEERKFTIENRRPGPRPHHAIMLEVAWFIALEVAAGRQIESAKEAARERYGFSLSTVERAWSDHKETALIAPIWKQAEPSIKRRNVTGSN
jgi:hypothetical protein